MESALLERPINTSAKVPKAFVVFTAQGDTQYLLVVGESKSSCISLGQTVLEENVYEGRKSIWQRLKERAHQEEGAS